MTPTTTTLAPSQPAQLGGEARAERAPRAAFLGVSSRSVLAASGFVMLGFVVLHLGGNLLAFAGGEPFNAYARSLRTLGSPLVGEGVFLALTRVVLTGALFAHLLAHARIMRKGSGCPAAATTRGDGKCPGLTPYVPAPPPYAAYPLPILRASGGAIFLFVVFHLVQLTLGVTHPTFDPADPYRNMVIALRSWPVAVSYVGVAAAVGAHLLPGVWTGMRSLGLIRPGTERLARALAPTVALAVTLGLAVTPAAVAVGLIK